MTSHDPSGRAPSPEGVPEQMPEQVSDTMREPAPMASDAAPVDAAPIAAAAGVPADEIPTIGGADADDAPSSGDASGADIPDVDEPASAAEPGPVLCPVCGAAEESDANGAFIPFDLYPTEQRELLARALAERDPAWLAGGLAHLGCLRALERELQRKQIVTEGGEAFYVDPDLGGIPIMPTPERMEGSVRFTGRGVTIAFVDSAFYPHPDLVYPARRIVAVYDAVRGRMMRDFYELAGTDPKPEMWHGTMTACAAAGNGYESHGRYRGLASDARVVLIRTMTRAYRIQTPQVVRALTWIKRNHERYGIRVVNMSIGVDEFTDSMEHPVIALVEELAARGIVVVAASGNNPMNPIKPPGSAPSAITAGGYNDRNSTEWMRRELWHFSYGGTPNGARKPELLAPSIWVAAPILPRTAVREESRALLRMAAADDDALLRMIPEQAPHTTIADKLMAATDPLLARSAVLRRIADEKLITAAYKHVDGTSFASPIIASIVAQMLEARPNLNPAEVKEILTATADPLPNVPAEVQGYGIVNAAKALEMTLTLVRPPESAEGHARPGAGDLLLRD